MNDQNTSTTKEPWEMICTEFVDEYLSLLEKVAGKQEKGGLDSTATNFKDITIPEYHLLKEDWKAFSRTRGFNEEDIKEYERWLVISGRRDFNDAVWLFNDILSKGLNLHINNLYVKLVELAIDRDIPISSKVFESYEKTKKEVKEKLNKIGRII